MRILYLSGDPGVPVHGGKGASVHLRAMVRAFRELGHEVIVCSPRIEPGENQLPAGTDLEQLPPITPTAYETAGAMLDACEAQAALITNLAQNARIDAIYERYSLAGTAGATAAAAASIPLILEVNAPLREEARRYRRLAHAETLREGERITLAAADRIFAVSEGVAQHLRDDGADPARVTVMHNAPPDHPFPERPRIADHRDLTAGFAGGMKPWHGIETLIAGFELAVRGGARIRLEILGSGPMDHLLKDLQLPSGRLQARGQLPHAQALDVLASWDIGIAPFTAVDGFWFSPLKLLEYMAAGLCPIVTDVGELPAFVLHGEAGIVVPPDDPVALAQALSELDRDRDKLRRLADSARQRARSLPSWTDNARTALTAIERAAARAAR